MSFLTIFTPTYNRAYCIGRLYESLCRQTCRDFEWLIVDDGSTDDTESLVNTWLAEGRITIRYIKQLNGGKHRAINRGVKDAKGELFFIVDSDDWLIPDAISRIMFHFNSISENNEFVGVCGLKATPDGKRVGGECNFGILDCSSLDFRCHYNIKGDMAEVVRTAVLRLFPFPEYENERFCPEALVWNRIALKYKFRYFYEKIYICEYLPDGLTAKITKLRYESPVASTQYYSEYTRMPVPFAQKIKGAINYWRFWLCKSTAKKPSLSLCLWWLFPVGLVMHLNDLRKI